MDRVQVWPLNISALIEVLVADIDRCTEDIFASSHTSSVTSLRAAALSESQLAPWLDRLAELATPRDSWGTLPFVDGFIQSFQMNPQTATANAAWLAGAWRRHALSSSGDARKVEALRQCARELELVAGSLLTAVGKRDQNARVCCSAVTRCRGHSSSPQMPSASSC